MFHSLLRWVAAKNTIHMYLPDNQLKCVNSIWFGKYYSTVGTLDFHDVGTPKQKFLTLHLLQILKHSVKAEVHYAASNAVAWFNKQWHKTGYPKHPTCRIQLLFGLVFSPKEKERFHPPLDRGLSWWAELEGGIKLIANWWSMCILLFFPRTVPQI